MEINYMNIKEEKKDNKTNVNKWKYLILLILLKIYRMMNVDGKLILNKYER